MTPACIALNRFGLGARPDEPAPSDPKGALLTQFTRYEPMPAGWQARPRTPTLLQSLLDEQRAVRQAADSDKQAARQAYQRAAREEYLAGVGARAARDRKSVV